EKTFDGPSFVTTTVYVVDCPATAVDEKSFFVVLRSALRTIWVVSVAEPSPGVGSTAPPGVVTVAVLINAPASADGSTLAVMVKTTGPPGARSTSSHTPP